VIRQILGRCCVAPQLPKPSDDVFLCSCNLLVRGQSRSVNPPNEKS
jgi:hypothetical protein